MMKLQNKTNVDKLSEELNELKLKIAKMNARRNAQINLLEKDLDGRCWRGTLLKPHHQYPSLYYDNPSSYRYPCLYPRYRSLENLLVSDSYHQKPYRKAVAFTTDRNNNGNLKSNVTSASMSDLLGKLKDFVFAQEKQLTDDLLNKIAQSRRPQSSMPRTTTSCTNLNDLTKSGPFLNPVNKKDSFYKRYNTFTKRILKPLPTPSTGRNAYTSSLNTRRSWLDNDEYNDYWRYDDEPPWTRWYHRYITSPRYRHYLSDYNFYAPKSFTLPPDIESIVRGTTKSTGRAYDCRSNYTPDSKLYPNKYDPSESDSYVKPRLPNWKQYYYTHKLKTKPSKESYLQYYDPHYDFFPDAASVDSTNELLDTSSAAAAAVHDDDELPDNAEQLINDYRDAIYEDVIQNLRTKQQRPSNTFPRRKPRRVERSLSPTFPSKRYDADWDVTLGSTKYNFDETSPTSATKNFLYPKHTSERLPSSAYNLRKVDHNKNEFLTNFSKSAQPVATARDVYRPSYSQSTVEDVKPNGIQKSDFSPQKENLIPARITEEFSKNLKFDAVTDVGKPSCQQQSPAVYVGQCTDNDQSLDVGTRDFVQCKTPEEIPSSTRRALVFSESVRKDDLVADGNDVYKTVNQPPLTEYNHQQYENPVQFPTSIVQSSVCNEGLKDEELIPSRMMTTDESSENTKTDRVTVDHPNVYRPLYQQCTDGYVEQLDEYTKPSNLVTQNPNRDEPQNENAQPARITQETIKFNKTNLNRPPSSKNDIIQSNPNATSTRKNVTISQSRNSNRSALNPQRDLMRESKTPPQQLSVDQMWRTESTIPSMDDSHHATSTRPAHYTKYSDPDQNYPELFDSNNIVKPAFLRRRSSQLIRLPSSECENMSIGSTELLGTATIRSRPALLRKYSSQLIVPQAVEECKLFTNPTESLDSTNSRFTLLRRRSSQLIGLPPSERDNISFVSSATTPFNSTNIRSASLRKRSSQLSQIIASPNLGQENIPITSANSSLDKSEWELVKKSSDANRGTVSSFRRQSTKLTPSVSVSEQDSVMERKVSTDDRRPHNTEQFAEYPVGVHQGGEIRDSDDSYKNTDFSQPIYEQPAREEKNTVDYYYDNNYPPSGYEADQRFYDDDSRRPIDTSVPYNERLGIYDPYEQSYYIQNDYYDQSNDKNYPVAGYDLNRRPEAYYPRVQNYDNYQNVNYLVEDDRQPYEVPYDSNAVGDDNGTHYILDTFPEEYAAVENRPADVLATVEPANVPPEELEDEEATSIAEIQPSENKETKTSILQTFHVEEVTNTAGSKMTNARDRKKSVVENSEIRNREPISRRASKISLQSAADDRRSKVQPAAAGESQKRVPKMKQNENKLKRTASTINRIKTPSTKRT